MSDYIKREDAMDAWYTNERYTDIEGIPSADVVEQKHGVWLTGLIKDSSGSVRKTFSFCSLCNIFSDKETRFCPNCGARMGGDS